MVKPISSIARFNCPEWAEVTFLFEIIASQSTIVAVIAAHTYCSGGEGHGPRAHVIIGERR